MVGMALSKVIIAGGGVAGTATALALLRAGIEAEVYEAHPSGGADAGAFLTVMRNGPGRAAPGSMSFMATCPATRPVSTRTSTT
jgi:glycine/D-amino acid oxidase-like deaminating enzyme